jgi:hypothetical protein
MWVGHVAYMGRTYRILVIKHAGKRTLGRPGHRQEDNIKINL